jgi:predicted Zn-dependent peptidase
MPSILQATTTGMHLSVDREGGKPYVDYRLANGLRVILHEDHAVPMVTINVLYHVGSKNETRGRTGFAHLFEHLMFDGSKNVPRGAYDTFCTSVGGDNNAFTSSDVTDYFIALPSNQLALGLWLESDRMAGFAIEEISLETQKRVVIEEKRQSVDDAPYGDMATIMHEMMYDQTHPYSWETIGSMEDIEAATMEDVRAFYERHYVPSNAVLVVGGNFDSAEAMSLIETYFGSVAAGKPSDMPVVITEPRHGGRRRVESSIVPLNAVFLGYPGPPSHSTDVNALEMLSSVLDDGESSRLYRALEYTQQVASETEAFVEDGELGSSFVLYAIAASNDIAPGDLEKSLRAELMNVVENGIAPHELEKARNQKLTRIARDLQSVSVRAERLAFFATVFDDPMLAFNESKLYESVTTDDVVRVARKFLTSVEPNVVEYIATNP